MVHLFEVIPAHTEFVHGVLFYSTPKNFPDALGRFDQRLGIFDRIVDTGGGHGWMRIGRSGGVPAGAQWCPANRDALGVDELAHIVRMHAGHVERHGCRCGPRFRAARVRMPSTSPSLEQFGGDGLLVGFDVLEPDVHHPFGGDACSHHSGDRLGAGLEAGRRGHVIGPRGPCRGELDHGAAEVGRRHFEQVALTITETDAGRTVHLVRAPGGEVHIKRVEIDLEGAVRTGKRPR